MSGRISKTRILKEYLLKTIHEHRIPIGGQLPSESDLMKQFSLSRSSVRQVMTELSAGGLIERRQGKGTFRVDPSHHRTPGRRSMLVGVWFNWPSGPLWGQVAEGIRRELDVWGYHAVFEAGGLEAGAEQRGIANLIRKDLDGFIVSPAVDPHATHGLLAKLVSRRVPVVLVDVAVPGLKTDLVMTNHELGAQEIVARLIALGHRRIGFIGLPGITSIEDRLTGYRLTLHRHGIAADPAWVQLNEHVATDTGRQAARQLLSLPGDRRPTAVFGANDYIAETFAIVARERGLRVPEDVSVAGFDDVNPAPERPPWLTTYAQPKRLIGQQAARVLMKRLADPEAPLATVMLQGQLVERASTGPPPVDMQADLRGAAGSLGG